MLKQVEIFLIVALFKEYLLAAVAALYYVVGKSGNNNAGYPWHG